MRKIIDNKVYDTETAEEISTWGNGYLGDFNEQTEALCKTPEGNYFRWGRGGAASKYGKELRGGEEIEPMSEEDANRWVEKYGINKYVEIKSC